MLRRIIWTTVHTDDEEKHRIMIVTKIKWYEIEFLNSGGFRSYTWTKDEFLKRLGLQYSKFRKFKVHNDVKVEN